MRKIYSTVMMLAMMVAALSFTACGGDDDEIDNGGGDVSIVGTWECTYFNSDTDYPEVFESTIYEGARVCFQSGGTYYTDYDETGRWSLKGNTLTVTVNDKISIPCDYTITKLTATALEFSLDLGILKASYKFKRIS